MKERLKNNLGLKLVSLLFAIILWMLVVNIDNPVREQTFRSIPVEVLHEEVITSQASTYKILDGTERVSVVVRAQRKALSGISLDDIKVTADLKERVNNSVNEASVPLKVTIKGLGTYEAKTNPNNLQIAIEANTSNKFPITVSSVGTPRDGYMVGHMKPNPESVTIGGGQSQINRIKKVVAKVDVSGLSASKEVDAELVLYDANDRVIDQTLLRNNLGEKGLTVSVEMLKTKMVPIEFDTSNLKPAPGYSLSDITHEPKGILIAGDEKKIKNLESLNIPAEALDISNISEKQEVVIDITPYIPTWAKLADETDQKVALTVMVEKYGTKTFTIPAGSIIVENTLAGLKSEFASSEDIELQITGSKENLKNFVIDKKVFVDLEQYTQEGTFSVPVQVELPEGCSLVEEVSVDVILEQK